MSEITIPPRNGVPFTMLNENLAVRPAYPNRFAASSFILLCPLLFLAACATGGSGGSGGGGGGAGGGSAAGGGSGATITGAQAFAPNVTLAWNKVMNGDGGVPYYVSVGMIRGSGNIPSNVCDARLQNTGFKEEEYLDIRFYAEGAPIAPGTYQVFPMQVYDGGRTAVVARALPDAGGYQGVTGTVSLHQVGGSFVGTFEVGLSKGTGSDGGRIEGSFSAPYCP